MTRTRRVAVLQQIHEDHSTALERFCLRLTGHDWARAEDLTQQTLLRAWRHAAALDDAHGSVRSWLFTVARNLAIDEWRTRRVRPEVLTAEPLDDPATPDGTDQLLLWLVVEQAMT